MMDIFVIDVGNIKSGIDPEMEAKADMIQYRSDLIRGCTNNRMIMKEYLDFMNQVVGEYVHLDVYHYCLDYVNMDEESPEYNDTLKEFALVEYIKERARYDGEAADNIHELPLIIKYELDSGGVYLTTENMQDFVTTYYSDERETLEKIMYLFSELNKYIFAMKESQLTTFRDRLLEILPSLIADYYNPYQPVMLDISYITMLPVIDLKFIC